MNRLFVLMCPRKNNVVVRHENFDERHVCLKFDILHLRIKMFFILIVLGMFFYGTR